MGLLSNRVIGKKGNKGANLIDQIKKGLVPGFGIYNINRSFGSFPSQWIIIPETVFGVGITDYEQDSEALLVITEATGLYRIEGATDTIVCRRTAGGSVFTDFTTPAFPTPGALFTYQPVSVPRFEGMIRLNDQNTYDLSGNSVDGWTIKGYLIYKKA